jgi:hypothetical protein
VVDRNLNGFRVSSSLSRVRRLLMNGHPIAVLLCSEASARHTPLHVVGQPSQLFADPQQLLSRGLSGPVANRVVQLSNAVHLNFFVISDGGMEKTVCQIERGAASKIFTSGYRNSTAFGQVW